MGRNTLYQIRELDEQIERLAGAAIRDQVMAGSEKITASTKPQAVAAWVQGAMERMDALLDEPTRTQIMVNCGRNCAAANSPVIDRARARRAKFETLEAFLLAEQKKPPAGMRVERAGDLVYQFYTPRAFKHPMRCYCSLLRGLPDEQCVSLTYCRCGQGFMQEYWEAIVGRPVQVELLESCVSGAGECKFAVHLD